MIYAFYFAFFLVSFAFMRARIGEIDKPFFGILAISTLYFGIAGPWYWTQFENGYFLGENWADELLIVPVLYLGALLSMAAVLSIARPRRPPQIGDHRLSISAGASEFILLAIGLAAAGYVVQNAGAFSRRGQFGSDAFLLLLYQVSDILIPVILFRIAREGYRPITLMLTAGFCFYAVYLGFRYKLVVFIVPQLYLYLLVAKAGKVKKLMTLTGALAGLGALFAVMTFARMKFGGLDFSAFEIGDATSLYYGFFAESNITFGLLAILRAYEIADYIYLVPLQDAILELVPRVLYPEKQTGLYLSALYSSLGSSEAASSGTAYPFLGEFYMMGGPVGVVFGVLAVLRLYIWFRNSAIRMPDAGLRAVGIGLLAVFFGYYYYSRGFTPQALKGLLFLLFPYFWLARCARLRASK